MEHDPEHPSLWRMEAVHKLMVGRKKNHAEAEKLMREGLEEAVRDGDRFAIATFVSMVASVLSIRMKQPEALAFLENAAREYPDSPEIQLLLATELYGRPEERARVEAILASMDPAQLEPYPRSTHQWLSEQMNPKPKRRKGKP